MTPFPLVIFRFVIIVWTYLKAFEQHTLCQGLFFPSFAALMKVVSSRLGRGIPRQDFI